MVMEIIDFRTGKMLEKFIEEEILQFDIDEDGLHSQPLVEFDKFKIKIKKLLGNFRHDYQKYYVLSNISDCYHDIEEVNKNKIKLLKEVNPDLDTEKVDDYFSLKQIEKIKEWIQSQSIKYKTQESSQRPSKTDKATHKQQMLILHYIGVLKKIDLLTQKKINQAKLISYLLNRDEKNTKTFIETMNLKMNDKDKDVAMTPKNLRFVHTLFIDLGLNDLANRVQEDLDLALQEK